MRGGVSVNTCAKYAQTKLKLFTEEWNLKLNDEKTKGVEPKVGTFVAQKQHVT